MKRLFKFLATSVATLAVFGLLAVTAFASPDNSEPLDEDPDDNADREQIDITAEEILLIDVRDPGETPTNDDDDGLVNVEFTDTSSAANAFSPSGDDMAAGDRYAELRETGNIDITANVDNWTLEVCNGGDGGNGNWLSGDTSGHSRGFSSFTEYGEDGDQGYDGHDNDGDGTVDNPEEESASFLALHATDFQSSMNDAVIAQGPNASSDHPTWAYLQSDVEDGTDCAATTDFTNNGATEGSPDGIADEDFQGPSIDQGVQFQYVFGYDVNDGTFQADDTTVLWTLSEGTL